MSLGVLFILVSEPMRIASRMVHRTIKSLFKLALTLCFVFTCFCWAGEQEIQYDNLSFGIPSKADTIIDRPGYALGYIERHEQAAWVIYIMTREEATTKAAKRTNKFRSDPEIPTGSATWPLAFLITDHVCDD